MRSLSILVFLLFCILTAAGAAESSFTQADRELMIRLEDGLKAVNQRIDDSNRRFDDTNRRIDDTNRRIDDGLKTVNQRIDDGLKTVNQRIDDMRGLLYVVLGSIFSLIAFVVWDRRTSLKATKGLEKRTERLELASKEKAEKEPELKEALRRSGA